MIPSPTYGRFTADIVTLPHCSYGHAAREVADCALCGEGVCGRHALPCEGCFRAFCLRDTRTFSELGYCDGCMDELADAALLLWLVQVVEANRRREAA